MVFIAFIFGSFPFSVWLGKLLLGVDVRQYGDGNPGAANVFQIGNKLVGVVSLILDVSKAAAPVGFAYFNMGIRGNTMALIAIAPILGHVFSPFLRFRGGKALAVALGCVDRINDMESFIGWCDRNCSWNCSDDLLGLGELCLD